MDEKLPEDYLESLVGKKVALKIAGGVKDQNCGLFLAYVTDRSDPEKGFQHGFLVLWDEVKRTLYTVKANKALYVAPVDQEVEGFPKTTYSLKHGGKVIIMLPVDS